jgi:hypothetical protein
VHTSLQHSGNSQPSMDREEHWHLDGDANKSAAKRTATFLYGEAIDGPNYGEYVMVKMAYNSTTGNYELLTAGSGGTPTTPSYLLMEDDSFLLQETGDKLIL